MQRWILLALLASVTLCASAAKRVSVAQLEQSLAAANAAHKADAEVARQIASVELSEQLTEVTLNRLSRQLSAAPQSLLALQLLADQSAFLDPPVSELPPDRRPTILRNRECWKPPETMSRRPCRDSRTSSRREPSIVMTTVPRPKKKGGWAVRSGLHLVDTSSRETSVRDARDTQFPQQVPHFGRRRSGSSPGRVRIHVRHGCG